ncbi:glycosyltransferase family 4 protein [Rhodoferax sp.]|uniref:glycosyltransferase family 4 protein n=1 Tax=Rhodoferax sp. TaxID=50421 RepID=UPI0008C2B831|nr:glycosyltransferase family 4 protein [Rhodoferax sp.]MDO8319269.1 glycosyltransferase family 4 protein [Rhodoferax sp.]MDP2680634.1 glycosyltransferase family 4 protein [Rhodoferax sp.]OGB50061.1 MAG: glycosyltransferase WbuB [Burkholderiales bacterium RIFOXYD12_FULL_59_19]
MKVLIISQYFWPENFRINDLVQELVQRGHSVAVLTGIPNYPAGRVFDAYRQNPKAFEYYGGARVWRVPMLARGHGAVRLFLNYLSFVIGACLFGPWQLRGQQTDVIFVFEPSPVTVGLPAILLGQIKRAPVVFWALDLWPETLAAIGVVRSPRVLGWVGHLVKFIYERCTLVLGQSRGFLESIARYCSDVRKIRYFPSWAEEVFNQPDLVPAPEVPVLEGTFNVLFAGNIGEAQDLPAVLDAAESLKHNPAIRWLIVGDGRKSDWLLEEVARRGLQDNVLLLGRFPVERMPSFYAHAGALLVSLKKDPVFSMTIPGKVQSYLMAGVPLVGMLDGEGAKVITEANAGLVCAAGDASGLAAVVLQMAAMRADQRHQLGANGRAFAQKEFGRSLLMDRLDVLLHEAVDLCKQAKVTT